MLSQIDDDDRVISANTFPKLDDDRVAARWIVAPRTLSHSLASDRVKYIVRATVRAARGAGRSQEGESCVQQTVASLHAHACAGGRTGRVPGIEVAPPSGAIYCLSHRRRSDDSVALAKQLVAEAGLGLAPGAAFALRRRLFALVLCRIRTLLAKARRLAAFLAR